MQHGHGTCVHAWLHEQVCLKACYRTSLRRVVLFLMLLKLNRCQYSGLIYLPAIKTMRKSTTRLCHLYLRCPAAWLEGQNNVI